MVTLTRGGVAANIVQGVGFLGAGLILHTRSRVLGLTSASTVFVVAAIGMACVAGLYVEAVVATLIVFVALQVIGLMEHKMPWKQNVLLYEVRGQHESVVYPAILGVMDKAGIRMNVIERDSFGTLERVTFVVAATRARHAELLRELQDSDATDHVAAYPDANQD